MENLVVPIDMAVQYRSETGLEITEVELFDEDGEVTPVLHSDFTKWLIDKLETCKH